MNTEPEVGYEMLSQMLDALDFPAYTFDKDRKVLFANAAMRSVLPVSPPGSAIGAGVKDYFIEHQYYDVDGNLLDYPNDSAVDRALRGQETRDLMLEHRNLKDHTHEWISVSCVPVMKDGAFSYGILWYRDISRIQSHEAKLRFLLKATRVLTITTDFRKRLREKAALAVPTLADWCGIEIVTPDGMLERVVLVHRDPKKIEWIKEYEEKYLNPAGIEKTSERVIRTGKPEFTPRVTREMIEQIPNVTEEQKQDIYRLSLTSIMVLPIGNPDRRLGILTLAYAESGREYTEEDFSFFEEFARHLGVLLENARLYNEINERDLYKDMFLASLSHELRNPLAPIKTSLELLKLHNPEEATAAEVKVIEHQFDHMARLLNDLLDATRFVRGKIRIETEAIDLREVLDDVVKAHEPVAREKTVELIVEVADTPLIVDADRTRIEQAMTNVLGNAVKFTPEGGKVTVRAAQDGNGNAVLTIQDTGVGITSDELARVFEPYYQSERVKGGNTGLGIGLRLVHEIMRLHGGTITAQSSGSGLGSEFTLTLPLAKAAEAATMPEPAPSVMSAPEPALPPKNILVIDDNQAAADALVRLFSALGWDAVARYSAREAFAHMDESSADIIFADIGMPEMNGYEFVKTLRENGYTDVPVVALTGYGLEEDRERALAAGFNDHLTKPVGVDELRRVIEALT